MPTDQAFEIAVETRAGAGQCPLHGLYWARLHECPECAVERHRAADKAFEAADTWPPGVLASGRHRAAQAKLNVITSDLADDVVNHPKHYTSHPSGIECIAVTRHMGFNLGNATKYIWRADLKHDDGGVEDLEKAVWYLQDEIAKRKQSRAS